MSSCATGLRPHMTPGQGSQVGVLWTCLHFQTISVAEAEYLEQL